MLDLTLDLDDATVEKLRERADRNGRSLEEEARRVLLDRLAEDGPIVADETVPVPEPRESAWDVIQRIREEVGGGVDFEPPNRSEWKDRPLDFGP